MSSTAVAGEIRRIEQLIYQKHFDTTWVEISEQTNFQLNFLPVLFGIRINFALACRLLEKDGFDGEKILCFRRL